jgi:hypothetical protein
VRQWNKIKDKRYDSSLDMKMKHMVRLTIVFLPAASPHLKEEMTIGNGKKQLK